MRKLILISNDDGYQAKGINRLVDFIRDMGDIVVCAPTGPRSGYSRSFTIDRRFEIDKVSEEEGLEVWTCTGTPVDCVKIACGVICNRKPDLVIGGINHGNNSSINAHYSGTVGIVLEGTMKGIPSVAFSLCTDSEDADFEMMRTGIRSVVSMLLEDGYTGGSFLNVNYPECGEIKGIKVCRMAKCHWPSEIVRETKADGKEQYHICYDYVNDEPEAEDTDAWALAHGYISVTPITLDVTDYDYEGTKIKSIQY